MIVGSLRRLVLRLFVCEALMKDADRILMAIE